MAYATWTYVLADLAGNPVGEVLDAVDRTLLRSLSAPATAGFKINATNARLSDVLTRDLNLYILRNNVLQFNGPILTAQLAADDATGTPVVACTAADPSWRFDHRISGKSATGTVFSSGPPDRLTIAETLISTAQAETNGNMYIQTLGQTCGSTATYIAGPYKKLSECISDMGNTLSGFDWYINPLDQRASTYLGQFKAAATLGSQQAGAVFEYQGRANAKAPNYIRGIETLVNSVYSIPDDGPNSALGVRGGNVPVGVGYDTASATARGLFEEVVDTSSITNSTLRDAVLNDHILYRKNPRQILSFQPDFNDYTGRVPEWGVDYFLGDTVRARVSYNNALLIDGYVRIYKMQFDIDQNGRETLTPTVVSET